MCVNCNKRKKTRLGAFCGNRCASKYALRLVGRLCRRCAGCGQYYEPTHDGSIETIHRRDDPCPNCNDGRPSMVGATASEVAIASRVAEKRIDDMRKKMRSAFTLVELLVVIVVIGVLLGLVAAGAKKTGHAANRARCLVNVHQGAVEWVQGVEQNRLRATYLPGAYGITKCPERLRVYDRIVTNSPVIISEILRVPSTPVSWDVESEHGTLHGVGRADGSADMAAQVLP